MANKKKSSTHTGQAGVVGVKKPNMVVIELSPDSIKGALLKIKEKRWKETKKEFQEWLDDPIDGSKCTYTSAQRLELIKFFKSKFLK